MSAFIPNDGPAADLTEIGNIDFFPDIRVADFRAALKVVDAIPAPRVVWELKRAMLATNRELHTWRVAQAAAGIARLADMDTDMYGDEGALTLHYLSAVYNRAKAFLIEKGRDIDVTNDGADHAAFAEKTVEEHFRAVREALAAILGRPDAMVELV